MALFVTRSSIVASDTTPDAFSFTDQTDVALSSTITSSAITVAGINAAATISITGGTYDINASGSFTSSSGSVSNGDTVRARHTSSGSNSTATDTVVTIGGVSDTFRSTTLAAGGGEEMGNIVAYSGFTLSGTGMQTIDLSAGAFPTWTTGGASAVTNAAYGVGGRYGVRLYPPEAGGEYSAIGQLNLFNAGGSATITQLYIRWCMQLGTAWAQNNTFDMVKHLIVLFGNPTDTRPMVYVDNFPGNGGGIMPSGSAVIVPAQGTNRYYSESFPGTSVYDGSNRFDWSMGNTTATTVGGKISTGSTEWVCFEYLMDSANPGLLRLRATRQDGTVLSDLDTSMTWQHDPAAVTGTAATMIDVLGGYFNGVTITPGSNNYMAIDRYISMERGRTTFAGPPTGFLS